jgi:hypothetical protein
MATDTTHPLLEERTDVILWLFSACGQWLMQESRRRRQAADDEPAAGSMTVPVHLDRKLLGKMAYFHNLEPILHDLIRRKTLSSAGIPRRLTESWEAAYLGTVVANADLLTVLFDLLLKTGESAWQQLHVLVELHEEGRRAPRGHLRVGTARGRDVHDHADQDGGARQQPVDGRQAVSQLVPSDGDQEDGELDPLGAVTADPRHPVVQIA